MGHGGGVAAQIRDAAVAVELCREVELPSARGVRHRDQTLVTVHERLLSQSVVDGHFHIVVAESQSQVEVLENLAIGLDLGTIGIRFPVEVVNADLVRIGIAVEDDLIDEIGAVKVGLKDKIAPTKSDAFGQVDAIVPSIFHLRCVFEDDATSRSQHRGVFGQHIG